MICRDGLLKDGPALGRVWVEAWRAAYAGLMPAEYLAGLDPTAGLARFERALSAGRSVLVLEVDSAIVGFSRYGPSRDTDAGSQTGEVIAINLVPSCWRRGLGKALLGETLKRLRLRSFTEVTLWVLHDNARARQFYEALGARPQMLDCCGPVSGQRHCASRLSMPTIPPTNPGPTRVPHGPREPRVTSPVLHAHAPPSDSASRHGRPTVQSP
jgi:ribosomal protein S18 acetylase RimI-like enzyme